METIHRRLHGVNNRRSHQCARPGWRPPRGSDQQLAADIADSIREHLAAGDARWTQPHEFTTNAHVQALVRQLLAATDSLQA